MTLPVAGTAVSPDAYTRSFKIVLIDTPVMRLTARIDIPSTSNVQDHCTLGGG